MKQYLEMMNYIMENGELSGDRTGVGTKRVPGYQMRFNMKDGFPIVTTKKVPYRIPFEEMLWFMKGHMDLRSLLSKNINIWNEWPFEQWINSSKLEYSTCTIAYLIENGLMYDGPDFPDDWKLRKNTDRAFQVVYNEQLERFKNLILTNDKFSSYYGDLRPMYGYQWRHWRGVNPINGEVMEDFDQLKWAEEQIKAVRDNPNHPTGRRIIVSAWNANQIPFMKLPPCHYEMQFLVVGKKLHLIMTQRSCDTFLGVPFNIAQYALLLHIMANICDLEPGEFVHELHDAHIYLNHLDQVKELVSRDPLPLPTIKIKRKFESIDDNITIDDFEIIDYQSHEAIKAPVAI